MVVQANSGQEARSRKRGFHASTDKAARQPPAFPVKEGRMPDIPSLQSLLFLGHRDSAIGRLLGLESQRVAGLRHYYGFD